MSKYVDAIENESGKLVGIRQSKRWMEAFLGEWPRDGLGMPELPGDDFGSLGNCFSVT